MIPVAALACVEDIVAFNELLQGPPNAQLKSTSEWVRDKSCYVKCNPEQEILRLIAEQKKRPPDPLSDSMKRMLAETLRDELPRPDGQGVDFSEIIFLAEQSARIVTRVNQVTGSTVVPDASGDPLTRARVNLGAIEEVLEKILKERMQVSEPVISETKGKPRPLPAAGDRWANWSKPIF